MLINTDKLSTDIRAAITLVLKTEASSVTGFDAKLIAKITRQANNAAVSIKSGKITGETRTFLVDGIRRDILSLVKAMKEVDVLTANRVHFTISVVVFKTISDTSGFEIKP
jgi:hypothetical protein